MSRDGESVNEETRKDGPGFRPSLDQLAGKLPAPGDHSSGMISLHRTETDHCVRVGGFDKTTLAKALESRLRAVRSLLTTGCMLFHLTSAMKKGAARSRLCNRNSVKSSLRSASGKSPSGTLEEGLSGIPLRLGARPLGPAVESAPGDVLFERIQRRGTETPPIEQDAVFRWFEMFQAPTVEEMALFDEPLVAEVASA